MCSFSFLLVAVFSLLTRAQAGTGFIKLKVVYYEGGIGTPLEGASVNCFEEDFLVKDEAMTSTVTTDVNGNAELTYKTKGGNTFWNPCRGWDCFRNSRPDIYCIISKSGNILTKYTPTLRDHIQENVADFGVIRVYPDRKARGDPGTTNGCGPASVWSVVRDVGTFLNGFEVPCNNHDLCYNSCIGTRLHCDLEFLDLMHSTCQKNYDEETMKDACRGVANAMFIVTYDMGDPSYQEGQEIFCADPSSVPTGLPSVSPSVAPVTATPTRAPTLPPYSVVDGCIEGDLTGPEFTIACSLEGLNCCTGPDACIDFNIGMKTICQDSCNGERACQQLKVANVEKNSCVDFEACKQARGSVIGEGSCHGRLACKTSPAQISSFSCNASEACRKAQTSVGSGSCNGGGGACREAMIVGNNSCNGGDMACFQALQVGDGFAQCVEGGVCLPTSSPTANPTTANPTQGPTATPTSASPTDSPTAFPTSNPTEVPTPYPTTANPTEFPTANPTTANPTEFPTATPTGVPTASPTTQTPTESPTQNPTTANPTNSPTGNPTTANPTEPPTSEPTPNPTDFPTTAPPTDVQGTAQNHVIPDGFLRGRHL